MGLSERVDLTENRDFRQDTFNYVPSVADTGTFSNDPSLGWREMDMIALRANANQRVAFDFDSEGASPTLRVVRIYPWNVYELDSDIFHESWFSEDPESNMFGVEFWDTVDNPFVLGNRSDRRYAKWIMQSESGLHCDCCGKKLDLFDEVAFSGYKYDTILTCKHCKEEHIYGVHKENFLGRDQDLDLR